MRASSSRCAPMSSARTPTRAGFWIAWLCAWVMNSPALTAISGYACLLQSLRSDVVGPHTRSCRFPGCVGLPIVGVDLSISQHRWWVRRPTTLEGSDWRRAAYPPAGRAQPKGWQEKLESDPHFLKRWRTPSTRITQKMEKRTLNRNQLQRIKIRACCNNERSKPSPPLSVWVCTAGKR